MYLMDLIAETGKMVLSKPNRPSLLNIYPDISDRLVGTPRFLFDKNAINTAVELTLGRPKVLLEAITNCRVPYPKLWVEWEESGREQLRQKFEGYIGPDRPLPTRVGFLLECDKYGRKGKAVWAWSLGSDIPNIGVFSPFFDLDQRFAQDSNRVAGLLGGNVAKLWIDNPIQQAAFLEIWHTAQHAPEGIWAHNYLNEIYEKVGEIGISHAMSDVYGEYIQMWACLLLLTSSRKIVELTPVSLTKLNRARIKQRKVPRLDHTVVSLYLDPAAHERQARAPLGYTRKSPRVHLVSSYLGRRGNKHWIVQPYTRGTGEIISRHVHVKGSGN